MLFQVTILLKKFDGYREIVVKHAFEVVLSTVFNEII